jgi:hypothetical protein
MRHAPLLSLLLCLLPPAVSAEELPRPRAENVLIVTLDGFRWQEFFHGADLSLMDKRFGGVPDPEGLKKRYWRDSDEERRRALLPFLWGTVAGQGQIFGDASRKAAVRLTNGLKFSYPGYNEMFCGLADPRIASNEKKLNPNLSVLEYLNTRPGFRGRVAAFCTWDVFPYIFRSERNGLEVHAGWKPVSDEPLTERQRLLNDLLPELPHYWPDNTFDSVTMGFAREHLRRHRPRVLYVGLGETDEWGHGRRYDLYLEAAHSSDRFLAELWRTVQDLPQYRGKTALLVTTDHGRGATRIDWTDHGKDVPGAEFIWIAVLGPDTPALGVRRGVEATQGQVAGTIAHLLGEDFTRASPRAAVPLPGVRRAAEGGSH